VNYLAMNPSEQEEIFIHIKSNLKITHAAADYVAEKYESRCVPLDSTVGIIPSSHLDAHLVLACDKLVDRFVEAATNIGTANVRFFLPSSDCP
jgi:hypothetical protein